jgi:hypothetical protein
VRALFEKPPIDPAVREQSGGHFDRLYDQLPKFDPVHIGSPHGSHHDKDVIMVSFVPTG